MIFKKKTVKEVPIEEKPKTLLDNLSIIETRPILESMIDDFMEIISNDNMAKSIKECFGDFSIPDGKTPKQFWGEIDGNSRICRFLKSVMNYAFEPSLRILSKIFCTPYEEYCKKTLNEVGKDLMIFAKSPFLGFFTSAVMSARVN